MQQAFVGSGPREGSEVARNCYEHSAEHDEIDSMGSLIDSRMELV